MATAHHYRRLQVRKSVVNDRIFTSNLSTPPDKAIPFHHELAQSRTSPARILFYCAEPAASGGATPLLDSRRVYKRLRAEHPLFIYRLEMQGVRCDSDWTPHLLNDSSNK